MLGVFWKNQEICSKTGTRISKIDGEMSEIIEPEVGNPENSISRNWATLSHPWNLTFLENDIFKLSSYLYGLKVPKWNCAHILLWKKAKNIRKTPKNTLFTAPWLRTTLLNDTVYIRSLPEEPHLAWVGATFSDFRHLSWAYFLCKWAKILICWCLTLLE